MMKCIHHNKINSIWQWQYLVITLKNAGSVGLFLAWQQKSTVQMPPKDTKLQTGYNNSNTYVYKIFGEMAFILSYCNVFMSKPNAEYLSGLVCSFLLDSNVSDISYIQSFTVNVCKLELRPNLKPASVPHVQHLTTKTSNAGAQYSNTVHISVS